jgi:hypothetical protein
MEPADDARGALDRGAILHGVLVGLAIAAVVALASGIADRADLAETTRHRLDPVLLVGLLAAYTAAGAVAARRADRSQVVHGVLAALGALACWIPIRTLIWAVRPEGRGFLGGDDPIFSWWSLAGQVVLAVAFGALGGRLARRRAAQLSPEAMIGPSGSARD